MPELKDSWRNWGQSSSGWLNECYVVALSSTVNGYGHVRTVSEPNYTISGQA